MNSDGCRALLLDLDGTLIGRNERISPRVAEAVGRAGERIQISIATGREPGDVLKFARQLGLTTPQIADNGALILDPASGREVWSAPLAPDHAEEIISKLHREDLTFIATHPSGSITDVSEIPHWNLTRVSALDMEEEAADQLVTYFNSNHDLHVVKVLLPYNGLWAVDFTMVGVNKGTSSRRLAEMLGIDASQMIAAGDSYNDLQMLQTCGLRIVMGDAPDELKAIADYIAPSVDDDGLAVAIEEFVMPRLRN